MAEGLFDAYLVVFNLLWLGGLGYVLYARGRIPRFESLPVGQRQHWPVLSVVVSARDEAASLEPALLSLSREDYPALEIVAVDDRSSDGTGELIDRLAAQLPNLQAVHIDALPEAWVGKVHALQQGLRHANGQWLLFTDADVHFEGSVLRRAVHHAEVHGLDHFTLLPRVITRSLFLDVVVRAFSVLFLVSGRFTRVTDPRSSRVLGIGAFNMVRRASLEKVGGFQPLRLEIVDDMALASLLKANGARTDFANADASLSVEWYPSVRAMLRGTEKFMFAAVSRYQGWRMVAQCALLLALAGAPVAALVTEPGWRLALGLSVWIVLLGLALLSLAKGWRRVVAMVLLPLGVLMVAFMLLRSGVLALYRGGIVWRETFYPLDKLRAHQRFKL